MADGAVELTEKSITTHDGIAELNRMLNFLFNAVGGDGQTRRIYSGYGSPLNVVSADVGSIYLRFDGGASTVVYAKESGTDGSGWAALSSASGGAPSDASYLTLGLNGTLTNERVLTAGSGISFVDGGANSTLTISSSSSGAPTNAQYVTLATDGTLSDERVLTAGSGISITDAGAGSTVTIASTVLGASYLTLGTNATLTSERVLTAGTGVSFTDGGAGSTLTINLSAGGIGGSDKHVQFNNSGAFGGSSNFQFDDTKNLVTLASTFDALGASLTSTYPLLYCLLDGTASQVPAYTADYVALFQNSGTGDSCRLGLLSATSGVCQISFSDSGGIEYGGITYDNNVDAWIFKSANTDRILTLSNSGNHTINVKATVSTSGKNLLVAAGDAGSSESSPLNGGDLTLQAGEKGTGGAGGGGNVGSLIFKVGSTTMLTIGTTLAVASGKNFSFDTTTGTKFGTSTTQKLSFYNSTTVVQQTDGANLTNNVTSGGTDNTIANYTDLTTYATDAAAIRNNIYQLARKVKIIGDALRTYGLLS